MTLILCRCLLTAHLNNCFSINRYRYQYYYSESFTPPADVYNMNRSKLSASWYAGARSNAAMAIPNMSILQYY